MSYIKNYWDQGCKLLYLWLKIYLKSVIAFSIIPLFLCIISWDVHIRFSLLFLLSIIVVWVCPLNTALVLLLHYFRVHKDIVKNNIPLFVECFIYLIMMLVFYFFLTALMASLDIKLYSPILIHQGFVLITVFFLYYNSYSFSLINRIEITLRIFFKKIIGTGF